MRWLALTLVAVPFAALPQQASAQTVELPPPDATAQGDVSVTIYNNDLALIQDTRKLNLPGGRSRQEFPDVSAMIRPETVTLSAAGTTIVEQNFDFDLLTPAKLLDKAVGQNVTLVRGDKTETVKVLANNGGTVIQNGNRIEVLNGYDGRLIFNSLPPNLRARPTLSVTLDAASGGTRAATLNYLSTGMGWKADYVALFDESAGKIDVQGWITLTNNTGTTFANANTLLVAGSPGMVNQPRPNYYVRTVNPNIPGNAPGTESANRERLGDYYVYPIKGRTTIANAQQKQVSFLDVSGAPAAKTYFKRNNWLETQTEAVSVDTVLRFSSSREGGLGDALPAGTVRVYMRDARGAPQFIGESGIGHTPMGSRLALKTGEAFDVKVQATVEKRERLAPSLWRTTMKYKFTNARSAAATVEFAQAGLDSWWDDTRIESESQKSDRTNSDEAMWKVAVPANGEAVVNAVFVTHY